MVTFLLIFEYYSFFYKDRSTQNDIQALGLCIYYALIQRTSLYSLEDQILSRLHPSFVDYLLLFMTLVKLLKTVIKN